MDADRLAGSPIGQLVPIQGVDARHGPYACFAYLPSPLPDSLDLSMSTISAVAEATSVLSRLDQACAQLSEPGLLIRPALYREALDTSALEGTNGQLSELLEAELPGQQFRSAETLEILGYVQAAQHAFEAIRERPVTLSLLAAAQAEMLAGLEGAPDDLGAVRRRQVWIGPRNASIAEARFVPPPGDDRLRSALEAWVSWVGAENDWPAVLRAAVAHYHFETLHPFSDGNGRIGRLCIILQLLRAGVLKHPAVTISPWLFRHREEYQARLLDVSMTGEWDPWVQLVCRALTEQGRSLIRGAERLEEWLEAGRLQINRRRWAGAIYDVLEGLTQWPVITIASVAARYDLTSTAATNVVGHLVQVGLVEEMTGRSYGRVFGARSVMEIVETI